jgi:Tfp pilus assembly protein PilZ
MFSSHGMAVFLVEPNDAKGRAPGAGIQFYAIHDSQRRKWEHFIRSIVDDAPVVTHAREDIAPVEPIRRKHQRVDMVLEVSPGKATDLLTMYTRDVSSGGMFLVTKKLHEIGTQLRLDIKHPETNEVFPLVCSVRRHQQEPMGIGVEFDGMDPERRKQFYEFVQAGVPLIEEGDLELVDFDDPLLE